MQALKDTVKDVAVLATEIPKIIGLSLAPGLPLGYVFGEVGYHVGEVIGRGIEAISNNPYVADGFANMGHTLGIVNGAMIGLRLGVLAYAKLYGLNLTTEEEVNTKMYM